MKKRLLTLIGLSILGISILTGGGTYAYFTSSATASGNQFGTFQTGTINIGSNSEAFQTSFQSYALMSNFARKTVQTVQLPLYYSYIDYPAAPNPYDMKTGFSPSGEIPGGWAPGDQVERVWNIDNKADGSKITEIHVGNFSLKDADGNSVDSETQMYKDFLKYMQLTIYDPDDNSIPVYTGTFEKLVTDPQPLDTVICLSRCSSIQIPFVVNMDVNAGNDLQGLKSVLDFQLGAEQTKYNCFDPPFRNWGYSMKCGSTTPIKFECYDSDGNFIRNNGDVKLVISGGDYTHTYTLGDGLSCNGGHYQANVYGDENQFVDNVTYTATVYNGPEICGQKTFKTEPGNRTNAK